MAVCSEIHTNTLCGQNVELLNVKAGSTKMYFTVLLRWVASQ